MRRSDLLKLTEQHWIEVEETRNGSSGEPVSCAIVPTGGGNLLATGLLGYEAGIDRVCSDVFVDFKGLYEDDGTPTENTLEMRKRLYGVQVIENAIIRAVTKLQEAALQGEESAASD